jgi:hypothetical protein
MLLERDSADGPGEENLGFVRVERHVSRSISNSACRKRSMPFSISANLRQFSLQYQMSLIKGQCGATHASFRAIHGIDLDRLNPV